MQKGMIEHALNAFWLKVQQEAKLKFLVDCDS